ncbi:MAG: rhodanese-like domain-containing protein [Chitinophagales bacterium]|nr:rhodanese-like domain-containing protein [Chitinophagales bacterium]
MPLFSMQTVTRTTDGFLAYFTKEFKLLEQGEFKHMLRKFHNSRLIDVSTKQEFSELHIPGSMNYDMLSPKFVDKIEVMDKSRPYFLYCRNGSRSEVAMHIMQDLGFKRVYTLASGIKTWKGTVARLNLL